MSLQLHHPDGKGGLEPRGVGGGDWRNQLRSRRWGEASPGGKLSELKNPEMRPTSIALSVMFWLGLAAVTFGILFVGYGIRFWQFGG